jgi:hypothetical protein
MITYVELVQWYCDTCHAEGEAQSMRSAEKQAAEHECEPAE